MARFAQDGFEVLVPPLFLVVADDHHLRFRRRNRADEEAAGQRDADQDISHLQPHSPLLYQAPSLFSPTRRSVIIAVAILKLQRAGFTEAQVEALAEFSEAGAATKSDIIRLEAAISDLDHKLDATRSDLENKIEGVRSDLESKIVTLDNKIDRLKIGLERAIEKIRHGLELKIAEGKSDTIRWVVGVGFAQVAMILTVLRLFPADHP